ncbi:MAG: Sua5/YciO/YrdC/YwlC family protein [bacterium]
MLFRPQDIRSIATQINAGAVGVFPCDTLFGIVGRFDETVLTKIRSIKGKSQHASLLALIPHKGWISRLCAPLSSAQSTLVNTQWPGPVTFVFDAHPNPLLSINDMGSIGLRYPEFLPLNMLLDAVDYPLFSTSVNLSGQPAILDPNEMDETLLSQLDFCYKDVFPMHQQPSTVMDLRCTPFQCLRSGVSLSL